MTRVVRTRAELRAALTGAPRPVGLVPTMGWLHDGHRALMQRARADNATAVVTIFVNPRQFNQSSDFTRYPRNEARDLEICRAEGVDLVWAPPVEEVYPPGFDTTVSVGAVATPLEGSARPGHFDGVATVVAILFSLVGAERAYFGQKDAQQAAVIRKLVRDLDMPVRVEVLPTVRDADGLALSSRNAYLSDAERERALALNRALAAAGAAVADGRRDAASVLAAARRELDARGVEPEYLELRSADDLTPVESVNGSTLLAVAARVGRARLIDNKVLGGTP